MTSKQSSLYRVGLFLALRRSKTAALKLTEKELTDDLVRETGEKIGIDWDKVDFDVPTLRRGILVEYEHSDDPATAVLDYGLEDTAKVAWRHLKEGKDYYVRLKKMENEMEHE